ncbi:MAG TPA: TIGR03936 family radical SAM-associated protein [Anaerolineaceae bacterium]
MNLPQSILHRYRITYARLEGTRYVGNLDMIRLWERSLRRAELPIAYSQGFSPQPRMHFASTLPVGFLSEMELTDIWFTSFIELDTLKEKLESNLPAGIKIRQIMEISLSTPPLQTQVKAADYQVEIFSTTLEDLQERITSLLEKQSIHRERRGKPYDLRPLIFSLKLGDTRQSLEMTLSCQESATGRPEEVLSALDLDPLAARYTRKTLHLTDPRGKG